MNQRDADSAAPVGELGHSSARSVGVLAPASRRTVDNEDEHEREQEGVMDYVPVAPRNSQTRLVRFRHGARLPPLPYSLDEENP